MNKSIYKIGFYAGVTTFASNTAFVVVQLLQLLGVITYPYNETLIYLFSLCIVIPFLIEILALHYATAEDKKIWSHAALIFTIIYSVFVTSNYIAQFATVIPMTLNGTSNEVLILKQTPHSLFWDFDAIGYICMGLAMLFAAQVFERNGNSKMGQNFFLGKYGCYSFNCIGIFLPNIFRKVINACFAVGHYRTCSNATTCNNIQKEKFSNNSILKF